MKKWYALVKDISKEIDMIKDNDSVTKIGTTESGGSCSTVPTEILKQDAFLVKYFVKHKVDHSSTVQRKTT